MHETTGFITPEAYDPIYTHKGWFWFCPIYLTLGDPCHISVRHALFWPLYLAAEALEDARIWLSEILIPDYEPGFMFTVTGEIKP